MSSTELFDAASISITSSEVARAIDRHDSHSPHGSVVGPRSQFRHAARIFAIEVLPVPREPTNRYAWWTLPRSTALRSVLHDGLLADDLGERAGAVTAVQRPLLKL